MNCNEARELFSPWLDGEMTKQEQDLFQLHLQQCTSCRLEFEQWENIALALRELGRTELAAPIDFSSTVMQLINQEQAIESRPVYGNWSKTVKSGIAAAVLLLFTILAMNSAPLLRVTNKSEPAKEVKTHYAEPQVAKQNTGEAGRPVVNKPTVAEKVPTLSKEAAKPDLEAPDKQIAAADNNNVPETKPVFLNKERSLTTTMLKLKVADPSAIQTQSTDIGRNAGARAELLGQQTQIGQRFVIIKFTVASEKADTLLSQLSSLGNRTSIQEEKQEITTQFNSTLEQYRNLAAQRAKVQDKEQAAQLDRQINSLHEQLNSLDKEAQEETIVLWLEE